MKKKLFTLMTLLLCLCSTAWAQFSAVPVSTSEVKSGQTTGTALTSTQATISGGTMYMVNSETTERVFISTSQGPSGDKRKCFGIGANKASFKVVLTNKLQAGDVITADLYKNNVDLWLSSATSRPSSAPTAKLTRHSESTSSSWHAANSYTVAENDGICGETTFYIYRNSNSTYFTNFVITPSSCTVSYNANGGSGEAMTNSTGASISLKANEYTAPEGYSFAGWNTAANGSGTDYAAGATVTTSLNLYAKWTQTVTLDANIANGGSGENGSAIAFYNGTALTSISHTTPASGNALVGYYTAATGGTKVLNADGTFASSNVSDYITSSAWTKTGATTLYAQYEEAAKYAVTHTLSNVTATSGATGDNAATQGAAYTAIFAPSAYYSLPDAVTVTIGGADATAGTDYIYTKASGTVAIPAAKVTGAIVITVTGVRNVCANPTITTGTTFNFANHGYPVTMTNNEDGSTLYYSINNEDWTEYTSTLYATATTHYYAKSVKANYDNGTADKNVTNTYNPTKSYVAWVYEDSYKDGSNPAYDFDSDKIVDALDDIYNVVPVVKAKSTELTASDDIKNADLIVSSEAVTGKENLAKTLKVFVGVTPMLHMKLWSYTSGRWNWASSASNPSTASITPVNATYKILNGVTYTDGAINMFDGASGTRVQNITWGDESEPENNVDMANADNKVAMHAIIDDTKLNKQFFAIGLSCNNHTLYSNNAITIVKNAAAMLIAGTERLDAEVSTVSATVGANGYTTFACSYPLDLTDANRPEGLKAYKATRTGANLTFVKLNQTVPAGTGLLLLGETKGDSYNIPVAASGTAVENNALIGVTSPVKKQSVENTTYYFVMKKATTANEDLKFAPITTAKEVTIPAGKAYIEVPNSELTSARELSYSFDEGNTTGINGVEEIAPVTKTRKVVKNGRLVIETAKGEFTIDGARVK